MFVWKALKTLAFCMADVSKVKQQETASTGWKSNWWRFKVPLQQGHKRTTLSYSWSSAARTIVIWNSRQNQAKKENTEVAFTYVPHQKRLEQGEKRKRKLFYPLCSRSRTSIRSVKACWNSMRRKERPIRNAWGSSFLSRGLGSNFVTDIAQNTKWHEDDWIAAGTLKF